LKPISPPLAWLRAFLSAAFGGIADGIIIGLGGASALSVATAQTVNVRAIYAIVLVNLLLDTARFVKNSPDPWNFAVVSTTVSTIALPPKSDQPTK